MHFTSFAIFQYVHILFSSIIPKNCYYSKTSRIHLTLGQKINKHNQKLVGRGLGSDKSNDTGGYVKIMQ